VPRQQPDRTIRRVPFDQFLREFDWRQGEHVTTIGKTGSGKTNLIRQLLPMRDFVCAIGTKPADPTMLDLIKKDKYKRIYEWPPPSIIGARSQRVALWPKFVRPEDIANQQRQIDAGLRDIFAAGGWTVFVDELWYLCRFLGMARLMEVFWSQARSIGITVVGGAQRPAWIPLMAYSQATHLLLFRTTDHRDMMRLGSVGGIDARLIADTVAALRQYEVLYVNTVDGTLTITKTEKR
jgi:hypothetical protein